MQNEEEQQVRPMGRYLTENINGKLVIGLRDVSHTMRALYEGRGSQRRVLILLRSAESITQRELTERLGIQSGSASEVIAKLEHMGLLRRTLSETDRRTADLSLTEEGRRRADEAVEQRQKRHEEMFSVLSGEEKEQLLALLDKINADWSQRYHRDRERCGGKREHARRCGRDRGR